MQALEGFDVWVRFPRDPDVITQEVANYELADARAEHAYVVKRLEAAKKKLEAAEQMQTRVVKTYAGRLDRILVPDPNRKRR